MNCKAVWNTKQALSTTSEFIKNIPSSSASLTTLTKNSWSNVGQNVVNRSAFDYTLVGEHLPKVLVNVDGDVGQILVKG